MVITQEEFLDKCRQFWEDQNVPPECKLVVYKSVTVRHRIDHSPVARHDRSFPERIAHARQIMAHGQTLIPDWKFSRLEIAAFLALPNHDHMAAYLEHNLLYTIDENLNRLRSMCKLN